MSSLRKLVDRRRSVANTGKMTRTMELVSATKLKQAQLVAQRFRPYAEGLHRLMHRLAMAEGALEHPLLAPVMPWRCAVLVISTDRGLCGSFTASLVRWGVEVIEEHHMMGREVEVASIGRKGDSLLRAHGIVPDHEYHDVIKDPVFADAARIADEYMARIEAGELHRVDVVYARVEGLSAAAPDNLVLLPSGGYTRRQLAAMAAVDPVDYLYHPESVELLAALVPRIVRTDLYSCLLQTAVAAHGARRVAMQNATSSADDLIRQLGRRYHRARQGRITGEIAEIVGTVEAQS